MDVDVKELSIFKGQISKVERRAQEIEIKSAEEYAAAGDLTSQLKTIASNIKAKKEAITGPLRKSIQEVLSLFAPVEAQYASAEAILKSKTLAYAQRIRAEAAEKEAAIAAKVEAGRMKLETAEKKIEKIERIENTTKGRIGEIQLRKVPSVRIIDVNVEPIADIVGELYGYYRKSGTVIPDGYWKLDMPKLRRDVLAGIVVPGAERCYEEIIASHRIRK